MTIGKALKRLSYCYYLLSKRMTGTPEQFGKKLGLSSKSQLHNILSDLKNELGFEIAYCKKTKTYYLVNEDKVDLNNLYKQLDNKELRRINGGFNNFQSNSLLLEEYLKTISILKR